MVALFVAPDCCKRHRFFCSIRRYSNWQGYSSLPALIPKWLARRGEYRGG